MKKSSLLYHILVLVVIIFYIGCATPVGPTGGPRDKVGPAVERTVPETGTVNFDGSTIEFHFDEFVNRSSVNREVVVEPDLGLEYELSWKRKRLNVEFKSELPDSTTIIITLGGKIKDMNSNEMGAPVTVAFSTGDKIDESSVVGRLFKAEDGSALSGERVYLYRSPFDLDKKATYVAETDTAGVFSFSYLREGTYKALFINDRNRNKIWESAQESAQPFFTETIELLPETTDTLKPIYITQKDTLSPSLLGVGLFSSQRMRLRFDEEIDFSHNLPITVQDSSGAEYATAYPLYQSPEDNLVIFAQADRPLVEEGEYRVDVSSFTDLSGNPLNSQNITFTGSAQEDTTAQRIIYSPTERGLFPAQPHQIVYAAPIQTAEIIDSLVIVEGDVSFEEWPDVTVKGNMLEIAPQEEQWIEDVDYQYLAWNPFTFSRQLYQPKHVD